MTDCIFCKIVAGDIPSRGVYSDDQAYAFLDLAPWHRGHSLVVPRRHVPDLITTDHALTEIAPAVDAVARLLVERLDADGVKLRTATAPKSMRLGWNDGGIIAINFMTKGRSKSAVALSHTKLPDKATAERLKKYWGERLDALGQMLTES